MLQKSCPKVRVAWAIFIIISPAKKLPSQCSHFTIVVLTQENGWEKKEVIKTVLSICTKCTISWRILRSHCSKSRLLVPKLNLYEKCHFRVFWLCNYSSTRVCLWRLAFGIEWFPQHPVDIWHISPLNYDEWWLSPMVLSRK